MPDTDSVLADIDGALAAYGTVGRDCSSPDAMRWSPDRPGAAARREDSFRCPLDEGGDVCTCGPDGPQAGLRASAFITVDTSEVVAQFAALARAMGQWAAEAVPGIARTMNVLSSAIAGACGCSWLDGTLHYHAKDAPRRVLRRCRACHPEAFTVPLAIDGREYRRRSRARRRR